MTIIIITIIIIISIIMIWTMYLSNYNIRGYTKYIAGYQSKYNYYVEGYSNIY